MKTPNTNKMSKIRAVFFGTPEFSVATLDALINNQAFEVCAVVTQPDKPAGRGQKLQASPVKLLAQQHNIPVLQPAKIRAEEDSFLQQLREYGEIDFGVVIAFGQILPLKTLQFPKYGCINIHASLLPRWRGAAPIHRALLAGDKETGVCIMKMEEGLDTGPVYSSETVRISEEDNVQNLHDKLSTCGAKLLIETLPRIMFSGLNPELQPEEGITYAQKITTADLMINWSDSTEKILLQIKTFSPKPAAYSLLEGKRFKIIKAEAAADTEGTNGEIIKVLKDCLIVKTSDAAIKVSEIQVEGKRAMSVEEFLRGSSIAEHSALG